MISCLEYDLEKKIDIICMQESWIDANQITISHSAYTKILSELKNDETHKQRVIIFVSKKCEFVVTSRSDLMSDTDIQILNISNIDLENLTIINVYNEKNQKTDSNEYTIERSLSSINLTENSIICEDFNAHHQWWNSKINSEIRSKVLIEWLSKFKCELINTSDEITFARDTSQ